MQGAEGREVYEAVVTLLGELLKKAKRYVNSLNSRGCM